MITSGTMEFLAIVLLSSANDGEIFNKKAAPLCANTLQVQLCTLTARKLTMPLRFSCAPLWERSDGRALRHPGHRSGLHRRFFSWGRKVEYYSTVHSTTPLVPELPRCAASCTANWAVTVTAKTIYYSSKNLPPLVLSTCIWRIAPFKHIQLQMAASFMSAELLFGYFSVLFAVCVKLQAL